MIDIKKYLNNEKIINILSVPFFVYLYFLILFGRTLNGLFIGPVRLGELVIGFSVLISIIILFSKNFFEGDQKFLIVNKILILLFLIPFFSSGAKIGDPYTYKASTYIWTISFMYLGMVLINSKYKERYFKLMLYSIPLIYVFNTLFFPNPIFNFFTLYSDKFDYLKASDMVLVYVLINFINNRSTSSEKLKFIYFMFSSGLLAPLMSFMSRGAFVAFMIFFVSEFIYSFRYMFKNKIIALLGLLICGAFLIVSSIFIRTDIDYDFLNFGQKIEISEGGGTEVDRIYLVKEYVPDTFTEKSFMGIYVSIFYEDGRFYSSERTANWRLQLWQDIIQDVNKSDKTFLGYGYKETIPRMTLQDHNGNDSSNENVHNYFVQVYARGGILHVVSLLFFNLFLIVHWKLKVGNFRILQFIIPAIVVSCFDPSLESVRFPFVYYSFLGYFLLSDKNNLFKSNKH